MAVLLTLSLAVAISFSTQPHTSPDNVTVDTSFDCEFTPDADGLANVTWYVKRDSGSWEHWTADDISEQSVDAGETTSVSASNAASNTSKHENWLCEVTLYNATDSVTSNSTDNVTIINSLPDISYPESSVVIEHEEDEPYSEYAEASDPDGDDIVWTYAYGSHEPIDSSYSSDPFDFSIDPDSGLMSFEVTNESQAGNHTVDIIAKDNSGDGRVRTVVFDVSPVNDSPEFGTLEFDCEEYSECSGTIPATDEEGDSITYYSNISSFINLSSESGEYSFTPTREDVGILPATFNITDGGQMVSSTGFFNISATNLAPELSIIRNSSLLQNETSEPFVFIVNASDPDANDTLSFSVSTSCGLNPWNITKTVSHNATSDAQGLINVSFFDPATWNEQTSSSNDFVACRNVSLTVSDGLLSDTLNVTFNITNTNDAPVIFNQSHYASNGEQTDIHNLSGAKGLSFDYRVNASDPDMATYENDSLTFSISGANASLFSIDPSTGMINSDELNASGNLSFNVTVTDLNGLNYTETANISVIDNNPPVIESLDNGSCNETIPCLKFLNATDQENDNLTYHALNMSHFSPNGTLTEHVSGVADINDAFGIRIAYHNFTTGLPEGALTSYLLNFTPEDVDVGHYNLTFSFEDELGITDTAELVFNVTNHNDAPLLNTSSLEDAVIVEDVPFSQNVTASDPDLTYDLDNLSFSFNFTNSSDNISSYSFSKTNESAARFSFLPNNTHIGNHTVNITVTDTYNVTDNHIFNITVHEATRPPNITQVRPYYDAILNTTNTSSYDDPENDGVSEIDARENQTMRFDIDATDEDPMTITWYHNGSEVAEGSYSGPGSYPLDVTFGFFDNGTHNITAVVEDMYYSSSRYDWIVSVEDVNRDPLFLNPIEDYSFENNKSLSGYAKIFDFFRQRSDDIVFLDPDDDYNSNLKLDDEETNTLSFSAEDNSSCVDYLSFEFDGGDVSMTPEAVGTCYTRFIATDRDGAKAYSNKVRFDITDVEDSSSSSSTSSSSSGSQTVQQTITIPLEEEVDVPEAFELIIPGIASIYENGTVVIPLHLKNSWEDSLESITLSANASFEEDVEFTFSQDTIDSIPEGGSVDVNLTMSDYRFEGPFEVNVSGHIQSLDHTDTATIYVNALEKAHEDVDAVKSRIGFARDLLSENSECQELNELLDEAEEKSSSETVNSLEMVNNVVKGCKYLINNEKKQPSSETPKSFMGRLGTYGDAAFDFNNLGTVLGILFFAAFVIGIFTVVTLKRI
ncbi:MAG: hypothetical protein ACLFTH_02715 [Candidatus Woesearchaeota archaeon]